MTDRAYQHAYAEGYEAGADDLRKALAERDRLLEWNSQAGARAEALEDEIDRLESELAAAKLLVKGGINIEALELMADQCERLEQENARLTEALHDLEALEREAASQLRMGGD